jgi:hypothetical protein
MAEKLKTVTQEVRVETGKAADVSFVLKNNKGSDIITALRRRCDNHEVSFKLY